MSCHSIDFLITEKVIRETRESAKIGESVTWVENKILHRGYINGIYPHICEIVEIGGGSKRTRCLQWHELIGKV